MAARRLLILLLMPCMAVADVVLDGSTGGVAGASVGAGNGYTYDITQSLGARRGENLFHSFQEFDIGPTEHANFSGADAIANIVARISSGMESSIEGRVTSTINSASLWLINPAGFVFGNGAVVDVNGVFHLTTSDFVTFSDGARFYADLSENSTLTSAPISQFGFLGGPAVGSVSFSSDPSGTSSDSAGQNLNVSADAIDFNASDIFAKSIDIVGGDVTVRNTLAISLEGGIFISGGDFFQVSSTVLTTGGEGGIDIETDSVTLDSTRLQTGSQGFSGGDVSIETGVLTLTNGSILRSSSGQDFAGGNIDVNAQSVVVEGGSTINLEALENSVAGVLEINTGDMLITGGSELNTSSEFANGIAGAIFVNAAGDFTITDQSSLLATSSISGAGGAVSVDARNIEISGDSTVNVETSGTDDSGQVVLTAVDEVRVFDSTINGGSNGAGEGGFIFLNGSLVDIKNASLAALATNVGLGGAIFIDAGTIDIGASELNVSTEGVDDTAGSAGAIGMAAESVIVDDGSVINLNSLGGGDGGTLRINSGDISLQNMLIVALALSSGSGGEIEITGENLDVGDGTLISVTARGDGDAGGLVLRGSNSINMDENTRFFMRSFGNGTGGDLTIEGGDAFLGDVRVFAEALDEGGAGSIAINTGDLTLDGASLNVSTFASGAGGSVNINAEDFVMTGGTAINAITQVDSTGIGGDVLITADSILIQGENGDTGIFADAFGSGNGGQVLLSADQVILDDAAITSGTDGGGNGGLIGIGGRDLRMRGGFISATATGAGLGGDIVFNVENVLLTDEANITAEAAGLGDGGNINITATDFTLDQSARLAVNSNGAGQGGDLSVRATSIDIDSGSISASAFREGDAGFIHLDGGGIANSRVLIRNGALLDSVTQGSGSGGEILITAESVDINTGSGLTVDTSGTGVGGDIQIGSSVERQGDVFLLAGNGNVTVDNATITASAFSEAAGGFVRISGDNVLIDNRAAILSETAGTGAGGGILLTGNNVTVSNLAFLTVEARGKGDGGDIFIGGDLVLLEDGRFDLVGGANVTLDDTTLTASAIGEGTGGFVRIEAARMNQVQTTISSETQGSGDGGEMLLDIDSYDMDAASGLSVLAFGEGSGGRISVISEQFDLAGGFIASTARGSGDGGEVSIDATNLNVTNGGVIASNVFGAGNGGGINIVSEDFRMNGDSRLLAAAIDGRGDSGFIGIDSTRMVVDDSFVAVSTLTEGNAGTIVVQGDTLTLQNSGRLLADTFSTGTGGEVFIGVDEVNIDADGQIASRTFGPSVGGTIVLQGTSLTLSGNGTIVATSQGNGTGGDVITNVSDITLTTGGNINVSSEAPGGLAGALFTGFAGSVLIREADNLVISDGGFILLETNTSGQGGFLVANSDNIEILDGAFIAGTAFGDGDAGSITLIGGDILMDGGLIESDTTGSGIGGDVTFLANNLTLQNGSVISTSSTGTADGGSIAMDVGQAFQMLDSEITTISEQAGGGNVDIEVTELIRLDNSVITATANGLLIDSDGGNIFIDPEVFTMRQSEISANAIVGAGGNITLVADNFIIDTESAITATSEKGIDGTVEIESPNQDVNPVSESLTTSFQNLPEFLSSDCTAPVLRNRSYLVIENLNPVKGDPTDYLHVNVPDKDFEGADAGITRIGNLPPC